MRQTLSKLVKILDGQPSGKRGQSLVEMALTTPLLILMVLSLVELGFFANDYLILLDAIRSGSRFAVNLDPTSWPYGDAHNQNRMDCDTDNHNTVGPGTPNKSTWNQYPNEGIINPSSANAPYGQRSGDNPFPGQVADQPRGMNLTTGLRLNYTVGKDANFGFFDSIACQVIAAMQPLHLEEDLNAAGGDQTSIAGDGTNKSKDDILISAISYVTMNYNGLANDGAKYASDIAPHNGYYVTVTGRWPIESRYCYALGQGDVRDPFDFMRHDYELAWHNGNNPSKNTSGIYNGTSLDNQPTNNPPQYEGPVIDNSHPGWDPAAPNSDWRILDALTAPTDSQGVRGYTFTGNHRATDGSNCWGSEFTVQAVERSLNLALNTSDPLHPINFNQSAPNGGLVIVEVYWQYHPLFFGPLFQGFTSNNKENDPVIHVWSFYPIPGIEPTPTPKPIGS